MLVISFSFELADKVTFWTESESDSDFLLFLAKFRTESESDSEANLRMEVTRDCGWREAAIFFFFFINGVYF